MFVTLEQARALVALARHGTFAGAALALHKRHTAVLYALRALEQQTELALLDRRAYRTRLTPAGERVLEHCHKLLAAEQGLEDAVRQIRGGWEPRLRVVVDGIFPTEPILGVVAALVRAEAPTRVDVSAEFLSGVEDAFVRDGADVMVSVLPPRTVALEPLRLAPIDAHLVAHERHPLARAKKKLAAKDLSSHVLVIVRGADPRLELSTAALEPRSTIVLNDFAAKKAAILSGVGFGWMPDYFVTKELARRTLRVLTWTGASEHRFEPRLYRREGKAPGRATTILIDALKGRASARA
jgi:DNA-binding transcriptional LysR family regulator